MYSWNNKTEPISARLSPGLKGRIDFECQQQKGWNRNKFLNLAAELLLEMRHDIRCGNMKWEDLPDALKRHYHIIRG